FGFSWSWRRASGLSAAKGRLSRAIGIPLTRYGRQRKVGRALGCGVILFVLACVTSAVLAAAIYAAMLHPAPVGLIDSGPRALPNLIDPENVCLSKTVDPRGPKGAK